MDIATLLGLLLGFGFVLGGIGSHLPSFFDVPSILIVVGGTFAVTTIGFKLGDVIRAQGLMVKTFVYKIPEADEEAKKMIELAQKARANGILSIQGDIEQIPNEFLKQAFGLAVDGTNPEVIEMIMKSDTSNMLERHVSAVLILKKSAEIAPAIGLIGTLIGLVIMLGSLDNPDSIGPAMAIALLTTMYGAVMANMIFNPMATKLELNTKLEMQIRKIYTSSVLSVVRQENPRQLELVLNTILPPSKRISMFD